MKGLRDIGGVSHSCCTHDGSHPPAMGAASCFSALQLCTEVPGARRHGCCAILRGDHPSHGTNRRDWMGRIVGISEHCERRLVVCCSRDVCSRQWRPPHAPQHLWKFLFCRGGAVGPAVCCVSSACACIYQVCVFGQVRTVRSHAHPRHVVAGHGTQHKGVVRQGARGRSG